MTAYNDNKNIQRYLIGLLEKSTGWMTILLTRLNPILYGQKIRYFVWGQAWSLCTISHSKGIVAQSVQMN